MHDGARLWVALPPALSRPAFCGLRNWIDWLLCCFMVCSYWRAYMCVWHCGQQMLLLLALACTTHAAFWDCLGSGWRGIEFQRLSQRCDDCMQVQCIDQCLHISIRRVVQRYV